MVEILFFFSSFLSFSFFIDKADKVIYSIKGLGMSKLGEALRVL